MKPVPTPQQSFGVDVEDHLYQNIIGSVEAGSFDTSAIQKFTQVSTQRDLVYTMID